MSLEPDQAGAQSHSYPQCQAHPIPLYESNNYIYYVGGLQSLQWLLLCLWASQQVSHFRIPKEAEKRIKCARVSGKPVRRKCQTLQLFEPITKQQTS